MKMASKFTLLFLPLLAYIVNAQEPATFDIGNYGGKPDANIAEALSCAWKEACAATTPSTVVVPKGTFMLDQVKLAGPCKAPIELQVQGTIQAPSDYNDLPDKDAAWITIHYVDHLTVQGGGVFDGNGKEAWAKNDCGTNPDCVKLPTNLSFNFITNSIIRDVTTQDSKNFHVNVLGCKNVTFQQFTVSAPGDSVNTDGLHISRSEGINVTDCVIKTGDDCISIGDGMKELHIEKITCGPGHGISVGSLGRGATEEDVTGIYVKNCTFIGTQNGIRVKTWPSAPAELKITDLHYEDIIMDNVENPIIIDQAYCPYNQCKLDSPSLIQVSQMTVKNIRGTSKTPVAMTFACSEAKPCENVEIGDIDLACSGTEGPLTTKCANIKPTLVGKQNPPICA
ncbi:exopolygalacturonase-like [Olea europaea var. sylvestris]|uniref:exopolygalacturonase-like n=1 Tax=Olea europaea var. sylvestris TaxID=158386 RepID=UPI000C1D7A73|nr:exopolygalacturonase-like [Olea europaea var. sylvestris]XP_022869945.1 exopolygalacturonase-like [Olea europaea var. sylvestris]XP_022869946.1 exopolygalacturonase-like [Olea europaea var. sylvestris]XP_022869947.1 exopolygalacturonase-like [Olea europaea var. sylvestris]